MLPPWPSPPKKSRYVKTQDSGDGYMHWVQLQSRNGYIAQRVSHSKAGRAPISADLQNTGMPQGVLSSCAVGTVS